MTTQYVLRIDKKDKAGRMPVYLVVCFDGTRLKCATGEKCRPVEWNDARQQFRGTFTGAEEANDYLAQRLRKVGAWWRKVQAADEMPTAAGLRAALLPPSAPPEAPVAVSVAVPYEQYREAMRARGYARETLRQHVVAQPVYRV